MHGSYDRIMSGPCHLTLKDLTGAPSFEFETKEEGAWERIKMADQKKYIMAAGSTHEDDVEES